MTPVTPLVTPPDPRDTDPLGVVDCPRCDWLRSERADRLVSMWSPHAITEQHGEAVRALALTYHAEAGHPDDWPRPSLLARLLGWLRAR